ncbi:unnamed protein product [Rotaria sp. Silwood2]|nr:unnamed protein product [Rotaria sp. Silwood2]
MRDPQDAIITKISDNLKEFTCITFIPDLKRFQMDKFDDYLVSLFKRRVYDVAVSTGCKVTLNGKRIPIENMKDYMFMYLDNTTEKEIVYKKVNDRWEIGIAKNDYNNGCTQVSFVNSILTSEGEKNCLIENPEFESQAKKQLATERKHFGSTCPLKDDENLLKYIIKKTGIVESIINWLEHK